MASLRTSLTRAISAASAARFFPSGRSAVLAGSACPAARVRLARADFFGCPKRLQCMSCPPSQRSWVPGRSLTARAAIKRRKDAKFDSVIQRDKKVRIVGKIKAVIVRQPGRTMTLLQLGKHKREFGLTRRRRIISLLNRYPGVFEVYEQASNVMYVRLTDEADDQYKEEQRLKQELEGSHVEKLRKLLMMSVDKRLTLDKISHVKHDLGLPEDFITSVIPKYPQFFKIIHAEMGSALELTEWDPLLAVSAAQKQEAAKEGEEDEKPKVVIDGEEIVSTALSNRRLNLPKGLNLSKKDRVVALKFQQQPYVSPYSDASELHPASPEAEKRACATVHELLSLTLEKKTLVDHLTHFKKDYKFSQRIRAMLLRHPEMFYVSFRGHRDSVFLREAYEGSELKEKDPLVAVKDRLRDLVHIRTRGAKAGQEDDEEDEDSEDEDEFSDEDEDDEDDEDESDDELDEAELEEARGLSKEQDEKAPFKSYAPSPRKPVLSYKDINPRPDDPIPQKRVATMDRPRERW